MLRIILFFLLSLFISGSVHAEQLKFVQVTDVHLRQTGNNYGARDIQNSVKYLENAVESINQLKDIDFVVFSGDNIDDYNKDDLIKFCEVTKGLKKPYYIGIGNHDTNKYSLSKQTYFSIVKKYNKHQKKTDSRYYFQPNSKFVVVMMDGVVENIPTSHGYYTDEDLIWLEEVLSKFENKKVIIVQHFPLVVPNDNKSHTIIDPEEYLELIAEHDNIIAVVTGHYHTAKVTKDENGITHISSPALVQEPHSYRVITINDDDSVDTELVKVDNTAAVPAK